MAIHIEIADKERALLLNILSDRLGALREEKYKTETPDFHDGLKREQELLASLIRKVENASELFRPQEGEHRIERGPLEKAS